LPVTVMEKWSGQGCEHSFVIPKVPVIGVPIGVGVIVGVGVGVTFGVGVMATLLWIFLLWSVNPVTELSLPSVCSPKAALMHLPALRHWFS
jgi:hypothetical protein